MLELKMNNIYIKTLVDNKENIIDLVFDVFGSCVGV